MKYNRKIIYLAGFLFSIPLALTSYINSTFLSSYLNDYYISVLYAFAATLTILIMLLMPKLISKLGNRMTTLWLSVFFALSLCILALTKGVSIVIIGFILYFVASSILVATLDIFVENFSDNRNVGKFRGFYISVTNIAWVVAVFLSGSIIAKSSFKGVYILSALFMLLVVVIFTMFLKDFVDPKYKQVPMLKTIRVFIRNKNLSKIYFIDFIIKFFYTWMVIYTPIYLNKYIGFDWSQIAIIFTVMLLPFVFLSFPLGKLSDTIGEKKILVIGFFIMIVSTLLIPFQKEAVVSVWAILLLCTRIGAASAEAMTESYFFKAISEENANDISFFRNTSPLSDIIAPLLAIPVLFYIPSFSYLFYVLGAILLFGFLVSLRLKDVR